MRLVLVFLLTASLAHAQQEAPVPKLPSFIANPTTLSSPAAATITLPARMGGGANGGAITSAPDVVPVAPQGFDYRNNLQSDVFGAQLFSGAFARQGATQFNPDYLIASGDSLQVRLWGAYEFDAQLPVDPQGNIFLPHVGPVQVRGVRNQELQGVVDAAVRRVFRSNVSSYASLAAAQPVRVFVSGFVHRPGLYSGTSMDSLLHYLDQAGGIDPDRGSFLNVQVKRGDAVRASVNLYDFLLDGRLPLIQLGNGDVIFVTPRTGSVKVSGLVESAKRFEFGTSQPTVADLARIAKPLAQATHVRVVRNTGTTKNTEYFPLDQAASVRLQSGDELEFTADKKPGTITVRVEGEHLSPQEYVLPYGSRLGTLMQRIELNERSEPQSVQLFRISVKERQKQMLATSLRSLEAALLTARSGSSDEARLRKDEAELTLQWVRTGQAGGTAWPSAYRSVHRTRRLAVGKRRHHPHPISRRAGAGKWRSALPECHRVPDTTHAERLHQPCGRLHTKRRQLPRGGGAARWQLRADRCKQARGQHTGATGRPGAGAAQGGRETAAVLERPDADHFPDCGECEGGVWAVVLSRVPTANPPTTETLMLGRVRERVWGWCKSLWGIFVVGDLEPSNGLRPSDGPPHSFEAIEADAQFHLPFRLLPGWYMLELSVDLPSAHGQARVRIESARPREPDEPVFTVALHSGRMSKRLIQVNGASHLRLAPMIQMGAFRIHHFRLKRVTPWFARSRMLAKVLSRDPRDTSDRAARHAVKGAALWSAYRSRVEPGTSAPQGCTYEDWLSLVEPATVPSVTEQRVALSAWPTRPRFSIITPTWNTSEAVLRECLDSVLAQTYPDWELCIADDASTLVHVRRVLDEYAARDTRVRVVYRSENGHIAAASNSALALATGDFIALLDHDDTLASHALFSVAQALQHNPAARVIYSDEDKLDPSGHRCDPFFKPDDSPDLLFSQNYMAHLLVIDRQLVGGVGGFRPGFEGSQDYDLLLRCLGALGHRQSAVLHIPKVLYHWRMSEGSTAAGHAAKGYATDAAVRALRDHFAQKSLPVIVDVIAAGLYRHQWSLPSPPPLVSLIIPTRDGDTTLRTCIESIVRLTTYPAYEIIVVDNQSAGQSTLAYLDDLARRDVATVLQYNEPFNYSAINNFAALHAKGSVLALVNDDVEVISPDWLGEMVSHAVRPEIGCVGAKLLYPDGTIQHAGVVLGIGGVAGHPWKYMPRHTDGYFSRLRVIHNVCAVTGAALVVRRDLFEAAGGLDTIGLTVAFNDVDFCLKVANLGVRNLMTPFAELVHHESRTRGQDETPEKQQRFRNECATMQARWGSRLKTDPFYNVNLTLAREDYSLAGPVDIR